MHILWDFDGTLIDSYPNYVKAFKQIVANDSITEEDIYPHLKLSFATAFEYFDVSEGQRQTLQSLIRNFPPHSYLPFPGVQSILQANTNVIMTHGPRAEVLKILQHHNMDKYFTDIVTIDDGFPLKPDPASYAYLHNRKPIDLAIGDRVIDILPAKSLGIQTCLFQNSAEGADYYLDDYADFHKAITR